MAYLTVPEVYRPALVNLAAIPDQTFSELFSALAAAVPFSNQASLATAVSKSVTSLSHEDLSSMLSALFSLSAVRSLERVELATLSGDVVESLQSRKPLDVNTDVLRRRLEDLLGCQSLSLGAKASALQREHEKVLLDVRVFSDLRPIFGDDAENLSGAVVVHMLKLSYMREGQRQEIFLALDDEDLEKMQKVIVRAEGKSKAIRKFLSAASLPDIDGGTK